MKKAAGPDTAFYLEQIPSIGREIAIDLKRIGLTRPQDLIGKNPYRLYQKLCVKDKMRYDPCMRKGRVLLYATRLAYSNHSC